MTEYSYFHNGTAKGDSVLAPYNAETFSNFMSRLNNSGAGYCLPGYLNNLEVTAGAGKTVSVNTGGAIVEGCFYKNDAAASLTLAANTSSYSRIDRIVVQLDRTAQTARVAVVQGTPATIPSVPAIDGNANVINVPLARVYLLSGYAATSSSMIFDERHFLNNAYHINNYGMVNHNRNSENMAFLPWVSSLTYAQFLPQWLSTLGARLTQVPSTTAIPLWDGMRRGRVFLSSNYNVGGATYDYPTLTATGFTGIFTLQIWVKVETQYLTLAWAGASLDIYPTAEPVEILIRVNTTGWQNLRMTSGGTLSDPNYFQLGIFTVTHGYIPADPTPDTDELNGVSTWAQAGLVYNGLSTGTTSITTDAMPNEVNEYFPAGIKGLVVCIEALDSGSAAAASCYADLIAGSSLNTTVLRNEVRGAANDEPRFVTGILPFENSGPSPYSLRLTVAATGAGTMDVTIYIIGYIL